MITPLNWEPINHPEDSTSPNWWKCVTPLSVLYIHRKDYKTNVSHYRCTMPLANGQSIHVITSSLSRTKLAVQRRLGLLCLEMAHDLLTNATLKEDSTNA